MQHLECSNCEGAGEYIVVHEPTACAKCGGSGRERIVACASDTQTVSLPPVPGPDQLPELFRSAWICPMQADRNAHRERALYLHYGLDWRVPEHKEWVAWVMQLYGENGPAPRYETND